ncbi:MAG: mechanosensitive ion channel [Alphaproteobacteria bacterium]|nr:mechanosensitive ion channel [Alphaproteobacteria bacterium]
MLKLLRCVLVTGVIALAFGFVPGLATANETGNVTVADLEDLVAAIEDDAEREELVSRLNTLIELKKSEEGVLEPGQQTLGAIVIEQLSAHSEALGRQLSALTDAILAIPGALADFREGLSDPATLARWTEGLLALVAVIATGFLAQSVVKRLLVKPLTSIAWREGEGLLMQIPLLAARLILILIPPAAFAAVGGVLISLFGENSVARPITLSVIYAAAIVGAINAITRTILAPAAAAARPVRLSDETAHYLYIWISRVTVVGIFGYFAIQVAGFLGLAGPAQSFLFKLIGLLLALLFVMLIMQNRRSVAQLIGGKEGARLIQLRRRMADLWHVLAILYVVVVYLVWVIGMPGGFAYVTRATLLTALTIFLAITAASFSARMINKAFSLSTELKARLPGLEARVNRYLPAVKSILRGFIAAIAGLAVLQAWGLDALQWLSEPAGRALVSRLASIGAIVLMAIVGWEALSAGIERYLASKDASHSQRARTLLPLIRKVILVALIVVVGLTVLSELGINIAPLLAGAGVVGLAVGFGAQTLVRDIITGLFILIEDTISVGDYVTLAGHGGTVEALSIRSIRMRDPSGTVHTIPFSDVTTVINYTREFAFAVLEIGVAYKEDVDRVTRVIEEVGQELRQDPDQQVHILDDLQVQGLDRFDDSAVVIKARIKTAPGMQWAIRRAFNRLLKRRFDAEGIEIPFPQHTIWFAEEPGNDAVRLQGKVAPERQSNTTDEPTEGDMEGEGKA